MEVDPDGGIQVDVLGEIRDRGEATDETNTLQVRLAVGPDKSEDVSRHHVEGQIPDSVHVPVVFLESSDGDDGLRHRDGSFFKFKFACRRHTHSVR